MSYQWIINHLNRFINGSIISDWLTIGIWTDLHESSCAVISVWEFDWAAGVQIHSCRTEISVFIRITPIRIRRLCCVPIQNGSMLDAVSASVEDDTLTLTQLCLAAFLPFLAAFCDIESIATAKLKNSLVRPPSVRSCQTLLRFSAGFSTTLKPRKSVLIWCTLFFWQDHIVYENISRSLMRSGRAQSPLYVWSETLSLQDCDVKSVKSVQRNMWST